ncbi:MAG TPA: ABC transporter permease [Mucilaginibacter sp.]|nr:ABC transporter permease [Mucilaginibacter sp.]
MDTHASHITPYDLAFLGIVFVGLTFALLLTFTKRISRSADRFLALALAVMALRMASIWTIDIRLPLQFSLALGPLIYFYVLKLTRPEYKFSRNDLLHVIPVLSEQFILSNSFLQFLTFISVITYLYYSHRLIERFYRRQRFNGGDRYRYELRWLHKLLTGFSLLWLLWIPYTAVCYFYYHQFGPQVYYPFYLGASVMLIWIAVSAHLRPEVRATEGSPVFSKPSPPAELKLKGAWLKHVVKTNGYYKDPDLSLGLLAETLGLTSHELSRMLNTVLKKSFNDFINDYRVAEAIRNMQDSAYDHLTLMGIAYDSGFNSKSAFHRIFKEKTGKSPAEYKTGLKKELPAYNLGQNSRFAALISNQETKPKWSEEKLNRNYMFRNYLKVAWRNLTRNKASSSINVGGLAVGMAVAMLIGLWIWDELSFNKYHKNYDRIAMVMEKETFNGTINTSGVVSLPFDAALRKNYGSYFKHVVVTGWDEKHVLNFGDKNISFTGNFMSPEAPEMLTLNMLAGNRDGLKDRSSILLSASAAKALFGETDVVNKVVRMDNKDVFRIAGIYDDFPQNTTFHDLAFIGPFDYYVHTPGNDRSLTDWGNNSLFVYVQIADNADMSSVSAKIRDIKLNNMSREDRKFKPAVFLQPMSKWHLYSEFKNGVNTGGAIQYVWLFGIIGTFVLLLACINFMNLSTARSEKRAKEVGIRKAVGSLKSQLVKQFYWESFLIALLSFVVALALVWLALSWFNNVAGKQITMPWGNPLFWLAGIGFTFFTGMIAGSYPALYLSSFNPVKVLKGTFKAGPFAAIPRKILVVTQFSVSIVLIIGTIVVFKQVQFTKDRPVGYNRAGLVDIQVTNGDLHNHFAAVKADLLSSGAVSAIAEATSATTGVNNNRGDLSWTGKDPSQAVFFGQIFVTTDYGKTVGWQFADGRDFIQGNVADSLSLVINEAAVKYMGFKHPIGQVVRVGKRTLTVIGVIKNMVMESPYEPVKQTIFCLGRGALDDVLIRINPNTGVHEALEKIAAVSKTYSPSVPFSYRFADDEYAKKFVIEERVGKLASAFAGLAIFISCLGLFGMASFMAEQRVKEIGVRKVLGASVFGLWRLMSRDFVILVAIALLIAIPLAYSFMHNWLQHYPYHTGLSWWVFAATAIGALLITLLTVSYQSIKAALANPVKSLRSE